MARPCMTMKLCPSDNAATNTGSQKTTSAEINLEQTGLGQLLSASLTTVFVSNSKPTRMKLNMLLEPVVEDTLLLVSPVLTFPCR